jgi:hypothetical protein
MTRFENLCVQCLLGFLLMIVVAGCGPGSGGTGIGPITGSSGVNAPSLVATGIATGLNFIARDVAGTWTDSDGTVLSIADNSISVRQGCNSFSFTGAWATTASDLAQVQGNYVQVPASSNNNQARNEPAVLKIAVPTAGRLTLEVVDAQNAPILRVNILTQTNANAQTFACQ